MTEQWPNEKRTLTTEYVNYFKLVLESEWQIMKNVKRCTGNRKHEKYSLFKLIESVSFNGINYMNVYRSSLLRELVKIEK